MGFANIYMIVMLFGVGCAFLFSLEDFKGNDDSNHEQLDTSQFQKDYIDPYETNTPADDDLTMNDDGDAMFRYRNIEKMRAPPILDSPIASLLLNKRNAIKLFRHRRRRGESSLLPPWKEYCELLGLECKHRKRSTIYRVLGTRPASGKP